jgi:hypothetical protein
VFGPGLELLYGRTRLERLCHRSSVCATMGAVSDNATGSFVNESRHVSVWVDVTVQQAYAFIADVANMPRWAEGLDLSEATVEFAPANDFGVVDHLVRLTGGVFHNPMRVLAPMVGERPCEVVFAVRRRPEMTDAEFDADAAAVEADLQALRRLLEG